MAVNDAGAVVRAPAPAVIESIAITDPTEARVGRMILATAIIGVVACVSLIGIFRYSGAGQRITFRPVLQVDPGLTAADDYSSVVLRLGKPDGERRVALNGAVQYRLLDYRQEGRTAVLMGATERDMFYIGLLDAQQRPLHSVRLPDGGNTLALLRALPGGQ